MIQFEKKYSRESMMLLQEIWMQTSLHDLPQRFGDSAFPRPAILLDWTEGLVDIWINVAYQDWLVASAGKSYGQDLELVRATIADYRAELAELAVLWSRQEASQLGLLTTLSKMRIALANLHTLFYVITCEDSLQAARDLAMSVRAEDRFFVDAENYIRRTLQNLLSDQAGLATFVTLADLATEIDFKVLETRRHHFLFVDGQAQGPVTLLEYIQGHPDIKLINQTAEVVREIKGQIAQPGKVVGQVRLVRRAEQAALVKSGEVIVAAMTTPDFLPAMKKAVAFVTDEGGITCHAAIVSRELKKPCIIGTKVATKVLKDDDLVEVDAERGVVTVLKRT